MYLIVYHSYALVLASASLSRTGLYHMYQYGQAITGCTAVLEHMAQNSDIHEYSDISSIHQYELDRHLRAHSTEECTDTVI